MVEDDEDLDADADIPTHATLSVSSGGSVKIPLGDGAGFTLDINRLDFQANKEEFERRVPYQCT